MCTSVESVSGCEADHSHPREALLFSVLSIFADYRECDQAAFPGCWLSTLHYKLQYYSLQSVLLQSKVDCFSICCNLYLAG